MNKNIPQISYKFWHTSQFKMYPVTRMDYDIAGNITAIYSNDVKLDMEKDGQLIQSTGYEDCTGTEIFGEDIIKLNMTNRLRYYHVFFDEGWRVEGMTSQEFSVIAKNSGKVLGSGYECPSLLRNYKETMNKFHSNKSDAIK